MICHQHQPQHFTLSLISSLELIIQTSIIWDCVCFAVLTSLVKENEENDWACSSFTNVPVNKISPGSFFAKDKNDISTKLIDFFACTWRPIKIVFSVVNHNFDFVQQRPLYFGGIFSRQFRLGRWRAKANIKTSNASMELDFPWRDTQPQDCNFQIMSWQIFDGTPIFCGPVEATPQHFTDNCDDGWQENFLNKVCVFFWRANCCCKNS